MRMRVDHRASRQLIDAGPWIFWRERADRTREGLVLELLPCNNRHCECRDVHVIGHVVGPNLVEIEATGRGLVLTYGTGVSATSGTQRSTAFVSFETGEVEAATDEPETADKARVLAWIADELDGELLDRLYDEWLHAKAWRRRDTHHEGAWAGEWRSDMGRMVGWHEAFPDSPKIFLRTSEPHAAKWIADTIGEVEIERLRESRSTGRGGQTSYGLERQIELLVMPSEIAGLPNLRAYLKAGNLVVRLSFRFIDLPSVHTNGSST